MTFLWFTVGLVWLVAGAELLVGRASKLALAVGISPLAGVVAAAVQQLRGEKV